jgi:hypothetical protein
MKFAAVQHRLDSTHRRHVVNNFVALHHFLENTAAGRAEVRGGDVSRYLSGL